MRKTDDNKILEMLKEGKQQKEIAEYFGVSPVAICKRIKRLCPPPETPNFDKLTPKEKKFVIEKAKGKSNIQAVTISHDVSTKESAKSMASQLMAKPDIKMAIDELMEYHGLTRSYRIQKLKHHVDHSDPVVSLKALDLSWKLDGSYAPEKLMSINYDLQLYGEINELLKQLRND